MNALENAERLFAKVVDKERGAAAEEERTARLAATALASFHEAGDARSREHMRTASEDAERARALHTKAKEAVATAAAKRDELARQVEVERLGIETVEVPTKWKATLAELGAQATILDRGADALLLAVARAVEDHTAAWQVARDRAATLGVPWDAIPMPTFDDAILSIQRTATCARETESREVAASVFDSPPGHGDWRIDGSLTAAERSAMLEHQAKNAAEDERSALVAHGVHLAVARLIQSNASTEEE